MATGTYYLTTNGGGSVAATPGPTWSTLRGATTGAHAANFTFVTSIDGSTYYLTRLFLPFNTTSLPSGSTINSATVSLYRTGSFFNGQNSTLHIIPSSQTDPTDLADADFDNVTFSSKGSILMSTTSNNTYFDITISDLTQISAGSYTKLAAINERDLNNTAPTADLIFTASYTSDANPPKLVIDYTPPPASFMIMF